MTLKKTSELIFRQVAIREVSKNKRKDPILRWEFGGGEWALSALLFSMVRERFDRNLIRLLVTYFYLLIYYNLKILWWKLGKLMWEKSNVNALWKWYTAFNVLPQVPFLFLWSYNIYISSCIEVLQYYDRLLPHRASLK